MSYVAVTELGRIVSLPDGHPYAIEMPCGEWERLSVEQFQGKTSVAHERVCLHGCTYHETHDFAAAVAAAGGFLAATSWTPR